MTINATIPTLYTRINSYVSWIYDNTRDACYCSYPVTFGFLTEPTTRLRTGAYCQVLVVSEKEMIPHLTISTLEQILTYVINFTLLFIPYILLSYLSKDSQKYAPHTHTHTLKNSVVLTQSVHMTTQNTSEYRLIL